MVLALCTALLQLAKVIFNEKQSRKLSDMMPLKEPLKLTRHWKGEKIRGVLRPEAAAVAPAKLI